MNFFMNYLNLLKLIKDMKNLTIPFLGLVVGIICIPSIALGAEVDLFHDSFGSVASTTITGWTELGANLNSKIDITTPLAGSPTIGYAFLGDNAGIATTSISTLGYHDIKLYYYWRGSNNSHASSTDALKVYWKRSVDASYILVNSHLSKNIISWSSEIVVNLPVSADNSSIDLKFVGATNWGVAGVSLDDVRVTGVQETEEEPFCSLSQGYWFAKPGVVWPDVNGATAGEVTIGNQNYTQAEGAAIWGTSNAGGIKHSKKGFLQVATIKLSGGTSLNTPASLWSDVTIVENWLGTLSKLSPANLPTGNTAASAAAGRIGDWIDDNHCTE